MISHTIRCIARMLDGDVVGAQVMCPGPRHSRLDRSLSVKLDPNAPGGFLTYSFAGDDVAVCRDMVRAKLRLPPWRKQQRPPAISRPLRPIHAEGAVSLQALRPFAETEPLEATVADTYLVRRTGRVLAWPDDLRFHPDCPRTIGEQRERHPALIVLLRDIFTDEPRAIQRIFLKPDGSDRLRDPQGKMCLGSTAGTVAKLSPDDCVTHGLGIAEGVETGLCLLARNWRPIWATIGTSGMAHFPVLPSIESLTVFADNDQNHTGERAALACIERLRQAGREAKGIKPRAAGLDWADIAGGGE